MSQHSRRPSHERWLVSYADFMTLLFAFFATMYAISSVDARKLAQVSHALQVAFDDPARGVATGGGKGVLDRGTRISATPEGTTGMASRVARQLADQLAAGQVEMTVERRGVVISIPEAGSFAIGHDELSPTAEELIQRVAATLTDSSYAILVEGHTDDVPIHTQRFKSNWDLSTARATRVVEFLSAQAGIAPARLAAAGYGEFHPRGPNDGPAGRARNRRIDIVVLTDSTATPDQPGAARDKP